MRENGGKGTIGQRQCQGKGRGAERRGEEATTTANETNRVLHNRLDVSLLRGLGNGRVGQVRLELRVSIDQLDHVGKVGLDGAQCASVARALEESAGVATAHAVERGRELSRLDGGAALLGSGLLPLLCGCGKRALCAYRK